MIKPANFEKAKRNLLKQANQPDQYAKLSVIEEALNDFKQGKEHDQSNARKPWTDGELCKVLSVAPTWENIILFAQAFKRSYGSIEQIYRWAGQSERCIEEKRADDKFVQQILRVRKEVGWQSVGR